MTADVTQQGEPSWARANRIKRAKTSAANLALARRAIAWSRGAGSPDPTAPLPDVPADWLRVAHAVVEHEGATWDQIGAALGMSKFTAASKFRRLLVAAGLR